MKTLHPEETKQFFMLWIPLLNYVNLTYEIEPSIERLMPGKNADYNLLYQLAGALYDDISVIDDFLADCPSTMSQEARRIVSGWKRFVRGKFLVERHLVNGSIFISMEDQKVYQVKGLQSTWEEMLRGQQLPVALETTLLPFGAAIISDGLILPYRVSFGSNYRERFKSIYMDAKAAGTILRSLP